MTAWWPRYDRERARRAEAGPGIAVYLDSSGYHDHAFCRRCAPDPEDGWTIMTSETETLREHGPRPLRSGCESCGAWPKTARPKRSAAPGA